MSHPLEKTDILIIGAGLIGSSTAMHLSKLGVPDVTLVDFDLEGTLSSSELNAGGVRATWNQPINIQSSKLSIEYYESVKEEVGYRDCGYLWLQGEDKFQQALKAKKVQEDLGWTVDALDVPALQNKVPFIDKVDGIAGAIFAPKDGLVNPNLLKNHFRRHAQQAGVQLRDRILIQEIEYLGSSEIKVKGFTFRGPLGTDEKKAILTSQYWAPKGDRVEFVTKSLINCAGAWAPEVAKMAGYNCPAKPYRRQVCIFDNRDVDMNQYGMIVDTSGVYFHPEATNILAGFADPNEPPGRSYQYDESFFMEKIWPALYERSSKFESLRHMTGWAGLYETSPDESAIIGRVKFQDGPERSVYEAHSFSGHGAMHSYAAGKGLAELITKGRYETLDLSALAGTRFSEGKLIHEKFVI